METRKEILSAMIGRLAQLLNKAPSELTEATEFESLNLKSVNYSQLTTYLEDQCDVEVPYMDFKRNKTLGDAADYVLGLING